MILVKNAAFYGDGSYFAMNASYSDAYAKEDVKLVVYSKQKLEGILPKPSSQAATSYSSAH